MRACAVCMCSFTRALCALCVCVCMRVCLPAVPAKAQAARPKAAPLGSQLHHTRLRNVFVLLRWHLWLRLLASRECTSTSCLQGPLPPHTPPTPHSPLAATLATALRGGPSIMRVPHAFAFCHPCLGGCAQPCRAGALCCACTQLLPCIVGLEVAERVLAKLRASLVPPSQAARVRVPRCVHACVRMKEGRGELWLWV